MAITAEDIQNVSFSLAPRKGGYDVDEVDVFLERVADEVDAMNKQIIDLQFQLSGGTASVADDAVIPAEGEEVEAGEHAASAEQVNAAAQAEIAELRRTIGSLEEQLAEKNANDAAISQALIVAQRSADDIVANAKNEASNIIKDADDEADRIVEKAEADRQAILAAIRKLEADRAEVRNGYQDMLTRFVSDAQARLTDIQADARREAAATQARNEVSAASFSSNAMPVATVGADPAARAAAMPGATVAAAPVQPSGFVEKDLSGYGDALSDFDLDDLD